MEGGGGGGEDDIVCLDESFFIDDNYQMTTFIFGSQVIELLCLHSASTDFDLTGQLVWPGAMLLNDYLSNNAVLLQGCTVLELGSGVGITGILCSRFCSKVVLTDHNDEVLKILKKNIDLHASSEKSSCCSELVAEKLEWGNSEQICHILHTYTNGFDLILGADICFQQSSICLLFNTVEKLLQARRDGQCKFILAYVSRTKTMDSLVISEAARCGMHINEVVGTRSVVGNLEGVIFEASPGITLGINAEGRSRIDQLKRLGHSVGKVEFILMGGTFVSLPTDYRDYFIRKQHDAYNFCFTIYRRT